VQIRMETADRVREILSARGTSLYEVSRRSAEIFGPGSPYCVPHNLYYDIAVASTVPNIYRALALSRISGYRLCDWLAVFGFRLDDIPRVAAMLPRRRTVVLDSSVYDERAWIPWFTGALHPPGDIGAIAPLSQFLAWGRAKRAQEVPRADRARFLYAKLGQEDALPFPDFVPGSVVRVNMRRSEAWETAASIRCAQPVLLVEHDHRLSCGYIQRLSEERIVLSSPQLTHEPIELESGRETRILGVVDAELRPLITHIPAPYSSPPEAPLKPDPVRAPDSPARIGQLLRLSRLRSGLSFREASALSREVAKILGDRMYIVAVGTLSDYETLLTPPRHVPKIMSLCILYSIGFWDFLRAAGLEMAHLGTEPIPDELVPRPLPDEVNPSHMGLGAVEHTSGGLRFLEAIVEQWEEIPLFLRNALGTISGLKHVSLSDVYWVGGDRNPLHPCLAGASFAIINRRVRKPEDSLPAASWKQPIQVVMKRDGSYLCGACTLRGDVLAIHPYPDRPFHQEQFRNEIDAEVVGQVTSVVRRWEAG